MDIGLRLLGRVAQSALGKSNPDVGSWLHAVEGMLRSRCVGLVMGAVHRQDPFGRPELHVQLHPSARPLVIASLGGDRVSLRAETALTGPGYHAYICELVDRLAAASGVVWEASDSALGTGDPTGYLADRDRTELQRVFQEALQARATEALMSFDELGRPDRLLLDGPETFEHDGAVATPFGPRPEGWLRLVAENGDLASEVYPWWSLEQNASYKLRRALVQMWTELRWEEPLDQAEQASLWEVSSLLADVYGEAPHLAIPAPEWVEILHWLGASGPVMDELSRRAAVERDRRPAIGYRRSQLRMALPGGWSIRLDGSMTGHWEDASTWVAADRGRTVWFTPFAHPEGKTREVAALEDATAQDGEILETPHERLRGFAVVDVVTEGHERVGRLSGRCAIDGQLAVLTVCFEDPADRDWAIGLWNELSHEAIPRRIRRPESAPVQVSVNG